jgi:deoxyxylulose-5-phosphate synthase
MSGPGHRLLRRPVPPQREPVAATKTTRSQHAVTQEVLRKKARLIRLATLRMPDQYSLLGPPTHLYRHYGLDAEGVAATVRKALQ